MVAASQGHVKKVRLLLFLGANSAIAMNDGRTAVNVAKTEEIRDLLSSVGKAQLSR